MANRVWVIGVRVIAALGVAAVIWGWGVAQYPVLLPGTTVTLTNAGAPHTTLVAIIWLFVAAVVLVGAAFALLFYLQGRSLLQSEDAGIALAGVPGNGTRPPAGPPASSRPPGVRALASGPRSSAWSPSTPSSALLPAAEAAESSAGWPKWSGFRLAGAAAALAHSAARAPRATAPVHRHNPVVLA